MVENRLDYAISSFCEEAVLPNAPRLVGTFTFLVLLARPSRDSCTIAVPLVSSLAVQYQVCEA